MATATKKQKALLDLPVSFGGVSIGDETARIGVSIDRERLSIDQAEAHLCGRRLTGWVMLQEDGDDHPDQGQLDGFAPDDPLMIKGSFDVKSISISRKSIHAGLTFALSEIKVGELAEFANRKGKLVVAESEELPEGDGNGEEGE